MPKFMICLGMLEVCNLCLRNMSEFGKRRTDSRSVLLTLFHDGCLTSPKTRNNVNRKISIFRSNNQFEIGNTELSDF